VLNDHDKHFMNLGKVVSNLLSLELSLRTFLLEAEGSQGEMDYSQLNVGDQVAEDAFTNWDYLKQLIEKYNDRIESVDSSLCVDDSVVALRDALAHGRVFASSPSGPMSLLKFTRPKKEQTKVTFAAQMDETWFQNQISLTHDQIKKVIAAGKSLGMNSFKISRI